MSWSPAAALGAVDGAEVTGVVAAGVTAADAAIVFDSSRGVEAARLVGPLAVPPPSAPSRPPSVAVGRGRGDRSGWPGRLGRRHRPIPPFLSLHPHHPCLLSPPPPLVCRAPTATANPPQRWGEVVRRSRPSRWAAAAVLSGWATGWGGRGGGAAMRGGIEGGKTGEAEGGGGSAGGSPAPAPPLASLGMWLVQG